MFKCQLFTKSDSQKNAERIMKGVEALKKAGLADVKNIATLNEHAEYAGKIAYAILDELDTLNILREWGKPEARNGTPGAELDPCTFTQAKLNKIISRMTSAKGEHNFKPGYTPPRKSI